MNKYKYFYTPRDVDVFSSNINSIFTVIVIRTDSSYLLFSILNIPRSMKSSTIGAPVFLEDSSMERGLSGYTYSSILTICVHFVS